MSLVSNSFIFVLLPLAVIINAVLPDKVKNYALFLFNAAFFILTQNLTCFALCLGLSVFNWMISLNLKKGEVSRVLLAVGIAIDAVALGFFKYKNFFMEGAEAMSIIVPLGISYFTFKNIGYLWGVYKTGDFEKNPIYYVTYALLFPQVTQGPIQKYSDIKEKLYSRRVSTTDIGNGLELFVIGFAMKALLTPRLTTTYSAALNSGYDAVSTPLAWMILISYILCLYIDFWGYSLMADGICIMLGFDRCINFNEPYSSGSVGEFWRRWHMSLGTFFKECVYFPLGGSKHGTLRMLLSTFAVWFLTGIWHGEGWTFIIWGMFSFVLILIERYSAKRGGILTKFQNNAVGARVYIILYAFLSWSVFMVPDLSSLKDLWLNLIPVLGHAEYVDPTDYIGWVKYAGPVIIAGIIMCTPLPRYAYEKVKKYKYITAPVLLVLFWLSVYFTSTSGSNPFMYAGF